jgi:hypothetical protein
MQIELNKTTAQALEQLCAKNFRTPELQILYWLTKEGVAISPTPAPKVKVHVVRKTEEKKVRRWTAEQKAQQRERMKHQWQTGKIGRWNKNKSDYDVAASATYDD